MDTIARAFIASSTRENILKPIAIAVLAAFVAAPVRAEDDPKKVQESLQGEWKAVEFNIGGKAAPLENIKGMKAVFKGNQLSIIMGKSEPEESTFTLNPKANPPEIDDKPAARDIVMKGIYKLEKDKLILSFGLDGGDRPKEFKTGKGTLFLVFERVKK